MHLLHVHHTFDVLKDGREEGYTTVEQTILRAGLRTSNYLEQLIPIFVQLCIDYRGHSFKRLKVSRPKCNNDKVLYASHNRQIDC